MKNLDLLKYAGKIDGNSFPASEWNSFVKDIAQLNVANMQTGKIESLSNGAWVDVTQSGNNLAAGGTYRISGYFTSKITVSGANPSANTKITVNGCAIVVSAGACIEYVCDSKKLIVIANAGTENYFIQSSTNNSYESKGAIHSEEDLVITGAGIIYVNNAVGHGVRGSKLELRGKNHVFSKAAHDAFHGSQVIDIYAGDYYILGGNDAFGTGERANDGSEDTKLRGIIRVFGGKFHVYSIGQSAFIFDAKYPKMVYGNVTGEDEAYYLEGDVPAENFTITQTYNSGFHCIEYLVDGPAVTDSNISNNFTDRLPLAAGSVTIGGVAVEPTSTQDASIYTITSDAAEVYINGYVEGVILITGRQPEIHLNNAMLVAPITGDYANRAIVYTTDNKNMQIQTEKGSEGNYVIGGIESVKNLKFSPKADSVLYIYDAGGIFKGNDTNPDIPLAQGSTIMFCNGGDTIITSNRGAIIGTELWIGNDDSDLSKRDSTKNFKGDIYIHDLNARLNSDKNNKGFIRMTADFEGNAFADNIKTSFAINETESGKTRVTGKVIGESFGAGKVYYKSQAGAAIVTYDAAVKYLELNGSELIKKFE